MRNLVEELKRFKGQPIELIEESGLKICGIECDVDDDIVTVIDKKGRTVVVVINKIEAIIEPKMKLNALCDDTDCDCRKHHNDDECDCD